MALDPSIALNVKQLEVPNQLAQYGQLATIQNAQQQNALANLQMQEYTRARAEEQDIRNRLAGGAKLDDPEMMRFLLGSKAGQAVLQRQSEWQKSQTEEAARRAKLMQDTENMYRNMASQIGSREDAAVFLQRMAADPAMKGSPIAQIPIEQQVARIPADPEGLNNWVKQFALGATKWVTENKPVTFAQDTGAGGRLMSRPGLGGAATVVPGSEFTKTATIADTIARDKFNWEKQNPGYELKEAEDGTFYGVNKRTLQAVPVTVGGVPAAGAPAAPAAGGVPAAPAAGGVPLKGKGSKDIKVSEQQAAYNVGRILDAATAIKGALEKDPTAIKPGASEAFPASVGMSGTANLARNAQRQIVYGAQRDALDAMLYLATGAAYNKEQLEGQMSAYIPSYTDKDEAVQAKQARMLNLIQNAKVRAGKAWTPAMDAAAQALMVPSAETAPAKAPAAVTTPAPAGVDAALWNVMTPQERALWQK